ncbi:undecaprenyl-diphosphate phosphatase [Opitutae bacterium]|nr:undecaprenyl-diphosphate phosphatase [Opitutae bacterium]
MKNFLRIILISLLLFSHFAFAEGNTSSSSENTELVSHKEDHLKTLNYIDCIILGLVEGITEYLPISSTGHLLISNELLGLNSDIPISEAYSLKDAAFSYIIIIQAGAILAVIFLYWKTILEILIGFIGKNPKGKKLGLLLITAFIPAAVIGLALNDWIEQQLGDNLIAIALALFLGGIAMLITEKRRKKAPSDQTQSKLEDLDQLNFKQAFSVGLAQCLALWPGISRSMVTIIGGYWVGLSPQRAAEFSFLLGLITLSAASGYKVLTDGPMLAQTMEIQPMLIGILMAFVSAIFAIRFLVNCLTRYGLAPFAWYRIALSLLIVILFLPKI